MQTVPQYDEKTLLSQIAKGDEVAFRSLFLHWQQLLAGYVFRITESRELTEDIIQDVFLKIWITRESLTEINNFKHFLLVVSRNQAFDVMKKLMKQEVLKRTLEKENRPVNFNENYEADNKSSIIDQAIDNLPPRRKEVWLLSRHERLTYNEIAEKLGISRESVKTHLKLATSSISEFIRSHLINLAVLIAVLLKIS